jgi:hypothetical protein
MPNAFRCATPMEDWRTFKTTCGISAGWEGIKDAGDADVLGDRHSFLYQVEDTVGAVIESADTGEEAVIAYAVEKIMVPKMTESADIFLPGMRVYWDPTTRLVTPTYSSLYLWIAIATEPAGADELYVEIDLMGHKAEVEAAI